MGENAALNVSKLKHRQTVWLQGNFQSINVLKFETHHKQTERYDCLILYLPIVDMLVM